MGSKVALQGNLDPLSLFASPEAISVEVQGILEDFGPGSGHIFNLGHGILPGTPPEHAAAMIEAVERHSPKYHQQDLLLRAR